jgi:histone-lysine N-methyltransferase SETD3
VLRADDRRLAPGEQLCASYGQKTSGELLLSYGFAPAEGANAHDACLLRIAAAADVSAAALAARGLPPARVFPLRLGALPRGLLRWAAFAGAEVSSAGEAGALLDALELEDDAVDDARLPPELRLRGLAAAVAACRAAAEGYRSAGAAAAQEAAALAAAGESGGRRATVLRVLGAEVRVLRRAEFLLGAELREARRTAVRTSEK